MGLGGRAGGRCLQWGSWRSQAGQPQVSISISVESRAGLRELQMGCHTLPLRHHCSLRRSIPGWAYGLVAGVVPAPSLPSPRVQPCKATFPAADWPILLRAS